MSTREMLDEAETVVAEMTLHPTFVEGIADLQFKYFSELTNCGFTRDEAIQIVASNNLAAQS